MNLKDLGNTVAKFAPALGSVLPLPGGALLGTIIGDLFGGSLANTEELIKKINGDTEAKTKLIQIELDHKEKIATLALQEREAYFKHQIDTGLLDKDAYSSEVADRSNARSREVEMARVGHPDSTPKLILIGLFLLIGLITILIALPDNIIPDVNGRRLLEIFVALTILIKDPISYYVGSGRRAKEATERVAELEKLITRDENLKK